MFSKEDRIALTEEFWAELKQKSKQRYGKRHSWVLQKTGIKGIQLKFEIERDEALVVLQCHSPSKDRREWLYDILKQYYRVIADIAGEAPIWDKEGDLETLQNMPSAYYRLEKVDYLQRKYWEEIHEFFIVYMKKMEDAYLEIKDVLKNEIKDLS